MVGWVAALSAEHAGNWEICRRLNLFGSGAPRAANVAPGDALYFWQAGNGLFARARVTAAPLTLTALNRHLVPWPQPERYRYLIDMEVLEEAPVPVLTSWKQLDDLGDLGRVPASQFPPVSDDGVLRIDAFFPGLGIAVDLPTGGGDDEEGGLIVPMNQDAREEAVRTLRLRRGQPAFRRALLRAYGRCVVSGNSVHAVLEAAHISPYRGPQTNDPRNGLLLRADVHTLFDLNMLTVLPDLTIRVAPSLNRSAYSGFDGDSISIPADGALRPGSALLEQHNRNCTWLQ